MSEFIVIAYKDTDKADQVLNRLTQLSREYLIDLDDAVVAVRADDGKVRLKQSVNLIGVSAATSGIYGALWGGLIGLLFLSPAAGMLIGGAVGAGGGALAGSLADYGINDDLIKEIAATIQPGSSALFLLVRRAQPEKVLAEFENSGGVVIRSSLSPEQEARLGEALSSAASQA